MATGTHSQLPAGVRLREYRPGDDVAAYVEINNLIYSPERTTVEQELYWESIYPQENPRLRHTAETVDGEVVAVSTCLRPFWMIAPGIFWLGIEVRPEWQRRGIGQAMLAALEPFAREQGGMILRTNCREDFAASIRFLEQAGFSNIGIRYESVIDVQTFDETPFLPVLEATLQAGYRLTTLAEELPITADADHRLYDLVSTTSAEVPFPGGEVHHETFENWRKGNLEGPTSDLAAMFIAKWGDEYVATTTLELPPHVDEPAITHMTGVLREHRRRGLATALKLMSFRYLKERGFREVRTHNDTANPPILNLNQKMGYRRLPGWLVWDKGM
jgi:RimJ/RimL family protein N-acetyltransferase